MSELDLSALSRTYGRALDGGELVTGGVNRTYSVRSGAKNFFLRIYRSADRAIPDIAFELRLLREIRTTPGLADATRRRGS